jgi:hypothetical protein
MYINPPNAGEFATNASQVEYTSEMFVRIYSRLMALALPIRRNLLDV